MKKIIILYFILFKSSLIAQSLSPTVVNSGGGYVQNGDKNLAFSVGETAVLQQISGNKALCQGFLCAKEEAQIAPVANFSANQTTINTGQSINFMDKSNNSPTSWEWTFNGGDPGKSENQNPGPITYNTPGTYAVTLKATNSAGNNSTTKAAYIIVKANIVAPVADFFASQTTVSVGDEVEFIDKSTNNPTAWTWTFDGGNITISTDKSPKVRYNTVGKFKVKLIAKNSAGQNSIEKADYIEVIQSALLPKPDFIADKNKIKIGDFVQFTDKSTNKPTKWLWSFPGGTPNTSDKQNPIIIYSTKGCYNVTLIAENGAGQAASLKTNFICVDGLIAIGDLKLSNLVKISPNPTSSILYLDFFEKSNGAVQIELLDCNSRIIKRLNTDSNATIPIDVSDLPSQLYYLKVQIKDKVFYEKVIIQK